MGREGCGGLVVEREGVWGLGSGEGGVWGRGGVGTGNIIYFYR